MITRRSFLKATAATGAIVGVGGLLSPRRAYAFAQSDPLQKWIQPMRGLGPNGIPVMTPQADPVFGAGTDYYTIGIGEFTDQLHPNLGLTRLWGFSDLNPAGDRRQKHLAGVIVANKNRPIRIRFTNSLPGNMGHIIPLDTTLPGANQAVNRTAIHWHGGHMPWISDGGPHDWFDSTGLHGLSFLNDKVAPSQPLAPGQADYYYPNDQSARLMWYHDHAWGTTRINAYAGIATAYLITDAAAEAAFANLEQIPLIWQDKVFVGSMTLATDPTWATVMPARVQTKGSLWYPHVYERNRWRNAGNLVGGNFIPPDPSCIPEMFGDTMLCNGTVYPYVDVKPAAYRFRMLNACNARFLNINLFVKDNSVDGITLNPATLFPTNAPGPDMIQIGNEGGFLPKAAVLKSPLAFNPVTMSGNLLLAPAERADVIIDFSAFAGKTILMYTDSPAPFPVGDPRNDYFFGAPVKSQPTVTQAGNGPDTRQILEIRVANTAPSAAYVVPPLPADQQFLVPQTAGVALPPPPGLPVRVLTLNEDFDAYGRLIQRMGTNVPPGSPSAGFGRDFMATPTEVINNGATEVWQICNLTGDTHPIHFHLFNCQILSRQPFRVSRFNGTPIYTGVARGPEANELGYKETVRMNPGEVTTIVMNFNLPTAPFTVPPSPRTGGNEYVYHCHILEHEEHDMMRPMVVM